MGDGDSGENDGGLWERKKWLYEIVIVVMVRRSNRQRWRWKTEMMMVIIVENCGN